MRLLSSTASVELWDIGFGIELPIEERRLDNGLRVILQPEPDSGVATAIVAVGCGARHEGPGEIGVSHLLEHCHSLGASESGPREIDRTIAWLGGRKNAFTSYDYTAYHCSLPVRGLSHLLQLEAERLAHLPASDEQILCELDVVREERRRKDDRQRRAVIEALLSKAYPSHPYGRPVIGTMDDLNRLNPHTIRAYFQRHYTPSNIALVIAGGFDRIWPQIEQAFGKIPPRPPPIVAVPSEPEQTSERRLSLELGTGDRASLAVIWPGPARDDADAIRLQLLSIVLFSTRISRIVRRLVRERQVAQQVSGSFWMLRDPSPLVVHATGRPGVHPEELEAALFEEIELVRARGVSREELDQCRAQIAVASLSGFESTAARAAELATLEMTSRRGWRGGREDDALFAGTTAEELTAVARAYLAPEKRTIGWQKPKSFTGNRQVLEKHEAPSALAPIAGNVRGTRPSPEPHGPAFRVKFPNGLTLLHQQAGRLPLSAVTILSRAGAIYDPQAKNGLSALMSDLLSRGTTELDEEAQLLELAKIGAAISGSRNVDWIQLRATSMGRDLPRLIELLGGVLRRPRFAPEVFRRLQRSHTAARRASSAQAAALSRIAARRLLFPGHPYRFLARGTYAGLSAIELEDLHNFHRTHVTPDRTVIAVVGLFEPERWLDETWRQFGDWTAATSSAEPAISLAPEPARRVLLIDKQDQTQAQVALVQRLFAHSHPDWQAMMIVERILGGMGLTSRLADRIRTREGLAYSVHAASDCRRLDGMFSLEAGTKTSSVARVLELMREEASALSEGGAGEVELDRVRAATRASLDFQNESIAHLSSELAGAEVLGLGPDYTHRYVEAISSMPLEDVAAAAKKWLKPREMSTIVVARREDVLDQLPGCEVITPEILDDDGAL